MLEVKKVAHFGAPEPVDALVGVADYADVAVGAPEQHHELVLGDVGVLVLVDEDVGEAILVPLEHVEVVPEQPHGPNEQVVEVHGVRLDQATLVLEVDLCKAPLVQSPDPCFEHAGVDEVGLGLADRSGHGPRREALLVDTPIVEDVLDEAPRVAVVVDGEVRPVADDIGVPPEDPHTSGVEGGHPHALRVVTAELDHPLPHLARCLVGEGDREDLPGRCALSDEAGDPPREDPRLARAGAGDDHERAFTVEDGLALGRVESGEKCLVRKVVRRARHLVPRVALERRQLLEVTEQIPLCVRVRSDRHLLEDTDTMRAL